MMKKWGWFKVIPQMLLILAFMPFMMGNEGCPVSQDVIDAIRDLVQGKITKGSGGEQQDTYVTRLSFIDAKTRSQIQTLDSELVNGAVVDGIQQACKANPALKFNVQGHIIKDTQGNVNKLIDLIFDPNLTPAERSLKIIKGMMDPAQVDVIVTGQFVDEQEKIHVKPLTIVKRNQKTVAKSLTFLKADYICKDPVNPKKKALCSNTYEEIAQAVKELLEQL
jgi:signal recognition particle subunit SEC65